MRKQIKNQMIELCDSILNMHKEVIKVEDINQKISFLSMCQECAIAVGGHIEKEESNHSTEIGYLEKYCEEIFNISQLEKIVEESFKDANALINKVSTFIKSLKTPLEVAFFPYQASMWDSLESIYLAFSKESSCVCSVVPVPYSEYQRESNTWKECYNGQDLPLNIPVIDYKNYNVNEMKPDIAFIHNPYDEFNYVTRVHEDYYSHNLKKVVKTLVYVPYAVTPGGIGDKNLAFSVNNHADYLVVQNDFMKDRFKTTRFYDKVLPFGSPKFDRVINASEKGGIMPKNWESKLSGKKIVMLNSTIGTLLKENENWFKKIKYTFEVFKNRDDVAIIWRPHPLLQATIKSMKPTFQKYYDELIQMFTENDIGVLDTTADITNTVALSDAYIGDGGSSVIYLFSAAGKPIFWFDYTQLKMATGNEQKRLVFRNISIGNSGVWAVSSDCGGIFKIENDFSENSYIKYVSLDKKSVKNTVVYNEIKEYNNELYLAPWNSNELSKYDIEKNEFITINDLKNYNSVNKIFTLFTINYKDKTIYLPNGSYKDHYISIYNNKNKRWNYLKNTIESVAKNKWEAPTFQVQNYTVVGNTLWLCFLYSNNILELNMDTEKHTLHSINPRLKTPESIGFTSIIKVDNKFWLAEKDGSIVLWNNKTGESSVIKPPSTFDKTSHGQIDNLSYSNIIDMEKYVVAIPAYSNTLLRINKETLEASSLCNEMFKNYFSKETKTQMPVFKDYMCSVGVKINSNTLIIQMGNTGIFVKVHVENDSYREMDIKLDNDSYERLKYDLQGEYFGFEKQRNNRVFSVENKYNSIVDLCDNLANNKLQEVKNIQMEALSSMSNNLDGTCGVKVCRFLLDSKK